MIRSVQKISQNRGHLLHRVLFSSTVTTKETKPLTEIYKSNVVDGLLSFDEKQYKLVNLLEKLQGLIEQQVPNKIADNLSTPSTDTVDSSNVANESTINTAPITSSNTTSPTSLNLTNTPLITPQESQTQRLRGVYIHGEVGTGKTMLMDMFFHSLKIQSKRRVHFSEFMLEVHRRVHLHKQSLLQQYGRDVNINLSSERDSITIIARHIATEASVLCFDEFQVTDICDAMILSRLFNELWKNNVVLIATSNRPPGDLYLNGLNRAYFLPFIQQLQVNCIVRNINIDKDYRQGGNIAHNAYFIGNTTTNINTLYSLYLTDLQQRGVQGSEVTIPVMNNRSLTLTHANIQAGVCYVEFSALCETDKGATDYHAQCNNFHTIYMVNIPILSVLAHNEARRLITLIDAMYNSNVRFVWVSEAPPTQLFEILTREQVEGSGVSLGTDHTWVDNNSSMPYSNISSNDSSSSSSSISSSNTTRNDTTPEKHLRGEEQARRPLDSNMYFGTTLKLKPTTSTTTPLTTTTSTTTNNTTNTTTSTTSQTITSTNTSPTTIFTTTTTPNTTTTTPTTHTSDAVDELKVLEGELASVQELSFAFRRAASRLTEMSSVAYLQERWRARIV